MATVSSGIIMDANFINLNFDESGRVDIKERMLRVISQSIEDDIQKNDMLP